MRSVLSRDRTRPYRAFDFASARRFASTGAERASAKVLRSSSRTERASSSFFTRAYTPVSEGSTLPGLSVKRPSTFCSETTRRLYTSEVSPKWRSMSMSIAA
jgi:hypothetical protein